MAECWSGDARSPENGFTLVELMVAGTLLAIGACGLVATLLHGMALSSVNTETGEAQEAARRILEQVSSRPVAQVFALFNDEPSDDPAGSGSAPGSEFVVESESTTTGSYTCRVIFPVGEDPGVLREDVDDVLLGMPSDLNGDGAVDSQDHSGDFKVLPVKILVTWSGVSGERTYEMATLLLRE